MARQVGLSQGFVAIVDDEDFDRVSEHSWHVSRRPHTNYARTHIYRDGKRTSITMHGLITGNPKTDHWDHDGLNNQKFNLRETTDQQNRQNSNKCPGKSSQYKGVTWYSQRSKWRATITTPTGQRYLGLFDEEVDAAIAYNVVAVEAFGEFACLNVIP